MRQAILAACLLAAVLPAWGCVSVKPMAAKDFAGRCYHASVTEDAPCDTVPLCVEYESVTTAEHKDMDACLAACAEVSGLQKRRFAMRDCAGAAEQAADLCVSFCRTNYPK